MSTNFTAGQKALLETALRLRLGEFERRVAARQRGNSRVEHAQTVLEQDGDDAPQRSADREVDLALSDANMVEIGQISDALLRLHDPDFGFCKQCGIQIPIDRLKTQPQAMRCVDCESAAEQAEGHPARATM